jgi:biopolymer transport protein ExbD
MKKFAKSHHHTMNELNITPLLDLAFVLLVIFIITTAPSVNDLDLNLPDPKAAKKGPSNKPNVIRVEADGKVFLNQSEMDFQKLRQELDRMRAADKDVTVVVRGHKDVEYQTMIKVFDTLQQADVIKVGIATDLAATSTTSSPQ